MQKSSNPQQDWNSWCLNESKRLQKVPKKYVWNNDDENKN